MDPITSWGFKAKVSDFKKPVEPRGLFHLKAAAIFGLCILLYFRWGISEGMMLAAGLLFAGLLIYPALLGSRTIGVQVNVYLNGFAVYPVISGEDYFYRGLQTLRAKFFNTLLSFNRISFSIGFIPLTSLQEIQRTESGFKLVPKYPFFQSELNLPVKREEPIRIVLDLINQSKTELV